MSENNYPREGGEASKDCLESRCGIQERIEEVPPAPPVKTVRKKKRSQGVHPLAVAAIVLLCMLVTFMTTYVVLTQKYSAIVKDIATGNMGEAGNAVDAAVAKINQMHYLLSKEYLYEIDNEQLTTGILKGYMYGIGDKYAEYFDKEEFATLMKDTEGEMTGIGIQVVHNADLGAIQVISVFPDSPAYSAGLRPGDLITFVLQDGEKVSVSSLGYTMALSALQGKEGTVAEFTVNRGKNYEEQIDFSIERKKITQVTVEHRVYSEDKTVGIIVINSFDSKTPEQFKASLEALKSAGCTRLVLDVRNNPGGELISVCTVLDMLLPEGPVIRTLDRDGNEEIVYTSDKNELDMPMAVIMNGSTASAGELFASALKDYDKAPLIGEKSFGKGSMQTIKSFPDGTGLKYTYRYYCPPFSDNFDGVGITPDVEVVLEYESALNFYTMEDHEDPQLQAAIAQLNK